jgi:hypothetical protein
MIGFDVRLSGTDRLSVVLFDGDGALSSSGIDQNGLIASIIG